jgi:hypothetical protein
MMQPTQNFPETKPSVRKLRAESAADAMLPGNRGIRQAPGNVTEGSARKFANVMDQIVGSCVEDRGADFKQAEAKASSGL